MCEHVSGYVGIAFHCLLLRHGMTVKGRFPLINTIFIFMCSILIIVDAFRKQKTKQNGEFGFVQICFQINLCQ
jgi:hypothetical protein